MSLTQEAFDTSTSVDRATPQRMEDAARRTLDIVAALALLVATLPVFVAIAVAIRLDSPGPAIFRQVRVGRNRLLFPLLKFRTMHIGTPELPTEHLPDATAAITRVGRLLRRTSLDELPQLINVLRGEMSLVGPRPLLYNHDGLLGLRDSHGLNHLTPGITGWAQINGRDEIGDIEKVALEREYAARRNLWLDIIILVRTTAVVWTGRGAN